MGLVKQSEEASIMEDENLNQNVNNENTGSSDQQNVNPDQSINSSAAQAGQQAGPGQNQNQGPAANQNPYSQQGYNYGQNPYSQGAGSGYQQGQPNYQQGQPNYGPYGSYNNNYSQPGSGYGPQPQQPQGPNPNKPKKKKKGPGPFGIVAIVLALCLIIGSVAYGGLRLAQTAPKTSEEQSEESNEEGSKEEPQKGHKKEAQESSKDSSSQESSEESSEESSQKSSEESSQESSQTSSASQQDEESHDNAANNYGDMALTFASDNEQDMDIEDVVSKTADSVVEITTETVTTGQMMNQYISSGAGSGVILTKDGYIITNNHVIDGANSITVTLHNGQSYDAELKGTDSDQDIAILKIDATDLTPAEIGDSDTLNVGQTIVVIGNPLGQLGGSVTHGIISALGRQITIDNTTMTLMQIDAAVNPGNSGGALFNLKGQLVGIVNAKSSGDDVEGIGFAIPIDDALQIIGDLEQYGYVKGRASLGVTLLDINSEQMAWMYSVNKEGIYIYSVVDGGAAAKAGLRSGDLIESINDTKISSVADVKSMVTSASVGDTLTFKIDRQGREMTIDVTVQEYVPQTVQTTPTGSSGEGL